MKALPLCLNSQSEYQVEEKKDSGNRNIGDVFAVSIVGLYTLSALIVSSWSAVLLMTGNLSSRNPIGLLVDLLKMSGLIS